MNNRNLRVLNVYAYVYVYLHAHVPVFVFFIMRTCRILLMAHIDDVIHKKFR